ncbi:MAG: hypothetical protein QM699_06000 [Amaricoccus sp.]|uniref:hypothetical protein n=1 Tax=Amaricoccus sp. TaxID=1872485 RepID=UPI0039E628F6
MSADCGKGPDFEVSVRRAFTRLTTDDLPRAAAARGWPVRTPDEFQRLLLDHLHEQSGMPRGTPPSLFDMILAVELGERLMAGTLCCDRMSRKMRCGDRALERLKALLAQPRQ